MGSNLFRTIALLLALFCSAGAFAAADISARSYLVLDVDHGTVLWSRNSDAQRPIASLTKLMTSMVVLDGHLDMNEMITITEDDRDRLKWSRSRVPIGKVFPRSELLQLALMASDNRAAHALARTYPGGVSQFVAAMNEKAMQLGLRDSHFVDPAGLDPRNVSTADDVGKMVKAAYAYPLIRELSTVPTALLNFGDRAGPRMFRNTNQLVRQGVWPIELSKTGYIVEAGYCLTIVSRLMESRYAIVLLDAPSTYTRAADAEELQSRLVQAVAHFVPSRVVAKNAKSIATLVAMRRGERESASR